MSPDGRNFLRETQIIGNQVGVIVLISQVLIHAVLELLALAPQLYDIHNRRYFAVLVKPIKYDNSLVLKCLLAEVIE